MVTRTLAKRAFSLGDQDQFATLSKDRNPIHVDETAARRTPAGRVLVHGIHVALWGLDSLARSSSDLSSVGYIRVGFEKPIYVGDEVESVLISGDERRYLIEMRVGRIRVMRLQLAERMADGGSTIQATSNVFNPSQPLDMTFDEIQRFIGRVGAVTDVDRIGDLFPSAARAVGPKTLTTLAQTSFLVGMVCPGLHSIFRNLTLTAAREETSIGDELYARAVRTDKRFKLVTLEARTSVWSGKIEAHARLPPAQQADLGSVASRVGKDEFQKAKALVIGGSRGLGELVSKIIASGGGDVTLTYATGKEDALRVQQEIVSGGGTCRIISYDVRKSASQQLAALSEAPNQVYYMATPPIFGRRMERFALERFQQFVGYYVSGFYDLYTEARAKFGKRVAFFYPSSTSVKSRPGNMTEYTMAKAAGEILCADLQAFDAPSKIVVRRLPRLPTDQTSALFEVTTADAIGELLPMLREVHQSTTFE